MDDGLLYETAAKDTLVVTGHHFVSENCHSARLGLALKITNDHTDGKCLLNLKISGSKIRIKKKGTLESNEPNALYICWFLCNLFFVLRN